MCIKKAPSKARVSRQDKDISSRLPALTLLKCPGTTLE